MELGDSGSGKSLGKGISEHARVSFMNDVNKAFCDGPMDTVVSDAHVPAIRLEIASAERGYAININGQEF
jgi:hypothetical protein